MCAPIFNFKAPFGRKSRYVATENFTNNFQNNSAFMQENHMFKKTAAGKVNIF